MKLYFTNVIILNLPKVFHGIIFRNNWCSAKCTIIDITFPLIIDVLPWDFSVEKDVGLRLSLLIQHKASAIFGKKIVKRSNFLLNGEVILLVCT